MRSSSVGWLRVARWGMDSARFVGRTRRDPRFDSHRCVGASWKWDGIAWDELRFRPDAIQLVGSKAL